MKVTNLHKIPFTLRWGDAGISIADTFLSYNDHRDGILFVKLQVPR
ncbi:hypothetical protein SAMN05444407_109202 [Chryseobacterium contaminans]|uniref:Uncharacterized protein n=1 Tax=Chryseobacterium contaminans TaxID=1423959 RepID=A0A1M7G6U5_9FLAO|nr:hypothetical protein SAMN05444407_109202 [Chryseobacterium contaminans]